MEISWGYGGSWVSMMGFDGVSKYQLEYHRPMMVVLLWKRALGIPIIRAVEWNGGGIWWLEWPNFSWWVAGMFPDRWWWMDTNHFLGCIWMYILYQLDVNYNQYNSSRWDGAMGQCIHLGLYFQLKYWEITWSLLDKWFATHYPLVI